MNRKNFKSILVGFFCLAAITSASAEMPQQPQGRVSDFAQIIRSDVKFQLDHLAARMENEKGAQLAVVTVSSLDGLTVEEYAEKLFNRWGVGHKGKDAGILFLIAPTERKTRIEVGYGLEGTINDGKAGRILDEAVIPFFKSGDYSQGILAGSERIAAEILQDSSLVKTKMPEPAADSGSSPFRWPEKLAVMIFFGLMLSIGAVVAGLGIRGDKLNLLLGGIFGGVPLLLGTVFCVSLHIPVYILPVWALVVMLLTLVLEKQIRQVLGNLGSGDS